MENEDLLIAAMYGQGMSSRAIAATFRLMHQGKDALSMRQLRAAKKEQETAWTAYKREAWRITNEQALHTLANHERRAFKGWHVDHVLSIAEGFKRGLPPETVGHISNLRMLPGAENLAKGTSTVFTNLFNE